MNISKINPFHIEAVATYGSVVQTCANLDYIRRAEDELKQYLQHYTLSDKRYGAAIGLQGGHGSGKTHLLMWLARSAENLTNIRPVVLYAKADRASIFDLYTQMLSALSRESLVRILDEALRGLALVDVQKAKVTQSLGSRIENNESLRVLQQEENIDLEALHIQLQDMLADPNTQIPPEIPRAITQLPDPVYGERIYQWLFGKTVAGLEDLKFDHSLLQLEVASKDSSGPDVTGVNVLETIAALLRLAGRPLIVLVDQLEVLLRADPTRQQVMFSVLKKLIEQINRQNAITFIAGNDEGWRRLPADVPPRLRLREPIRVGNLSVGETRSLIESYTKESRLSEEAIQSIHSLSGGNPREIIRIAYYAYEKTGGEIENASAATFVESANESGSVAERTRRALEIADEVLRDAGSVQKDLAVTDSAVIDRLLLSQNRPRLALLAIKATDQLSEINSARRVHDVRKYIEDTWQEMPLVVVAVGYSSDEVRTLLGTAAMFIQFSEVVFAGELKTKVAELLAHQASVEPTTRERGADPAVLEALSKIALRLDRFEEERKTEAHSVVERFAASTEDLHAPAEKARELRTRWDLLSALDEVQTALNKKEMWREQELMKSLLVANEVNLKLKQLDYLGGIYLDVLSEESNPNVDWEAPETSSSFEPRLADYRRDILRELRRLLRSRRLIDRWLEAPLVTSALTLGAVIALEFVCTYFWWRVFSDDYPGAENRFSEWVWNRTLRVWIPLALFTLVCGFGMSVFIKWTRNHRWERISRRVARKSFLSTPSAR
jgi:chorismate mutase